MSEHYNAKTGSWISAAGDAAQAASSGDWSGLQAAAVRGVALGTKNAVIFRSQLTPEFRFDLASLAQAEAPAPRSPVGWVIDWLMSSVVRPEIEISAVGMTRTVAPWGKPEKDYAPIVAIGLGAALVSGIGLAWMWSRKRGR